MPPIPVSVVTTIDPVLRESALAGLVLGSPGAVAVRHDLLEGALRRVVVDATGVVEDVTVPLEHACLSCCVRQDAVPTLARLAADGPWSDVVLALPVTADPLPVVRALVTAMAPAGALAHTRLAATVAVVDLDDAESDLLDDGLCAERGLALGEDDERAVGEALAAQVEKVDLLVTVGQDATGSGLVDRLRAVGSRRLDGLHALAASDLSVGHHDPARAEARAHPLGARGPERPDGGPWSGSGDDRSWTLVLDAARPLHPDRLLDQIERLGAGRLRSRGVFRVVNRPDSACLWDGAGGQLCVADLGPWDEAAPHHSPHTRLCFVGAGDHDDAQALRATIVNAFFAAVTRPEEIADGGLAWLGREDVLAPWLGDRATSYLGA
ncbi:GTP-binding protein [Xylanimonas ulmi]|uniref:G3E family GTPase n=1 Tax=Xylanimonas ulmi TaxID=228973 RepID=A0A4Q7M0S5_9MICO|nr:GTP-binding protein [Xylanibacterium ulmi]RZS60974.1 G3E family GTPase [Xylanibacterium ulmi]